MPDSIESLCRIPGAGEAADPHGENPFSIQDARHEVWAKATRRAEEELSRLKVELMSKPATTAQEFFRFVVGFWVAQFHIWAKRSIHVVWGDFNIEPYDNWVTTYAESILKLVSGRSYIGIDKESLLTELRTRLFQGVEYWKAEARRYVSQQPPEMSLGDDTEPKPGESSGKDAGPAVNATEPGGTARRAAVDAFLLRCNQVTAVNATRTHIWRAVGHRAALQFQFWQAYDPKATARDDQNFRRILSMNPTDFESLLKKKGII